MQLTIQSVNWEVVNILAIYQKRRQNSQESSRNFVNNEIENDQNEAPDDQNIEDVVELRPEEELLNFEEDPELTTMVTLQEKDGEIATEMVVSHGLAPASEASEGEEGHVMEEDENSEVVFNQCVQFGLKNNNATSNVSPMIEK